MSRYLGDEKIDCPLCDGTGSFVSGRICLLCEGEGIVGLRFFETPLLDIPEPENRKRYKNEIWSTLLCSEEMVERMMEDDAR